MSGGCALAAGSPPGRKVWLLRTVQRLQPRSNRITTSTESPQLGLNQSAYGSKAAQTNRDRSSSAELRQDPDQLRAELANNATAMFGETAGMIGTGYSFLRFSNVLYGTGAIPSRVRYAAQNQRALDWIAPAPGSLLTKAKEK